VGTLFVYRSYQGIRFLDAGKHTETIALEIGPGGVIEIHSDKLGKNKRIVMDFLQKVDLQKIDAFMKQL
jgi:hypothetical protein